MKKCTKCHIDKEYSSFSKKGNGLRPYCKQCASKLGKIAKDSIRKKTFTFDYVLEKIKSDDIKGIAYSEIQTKIVLGATDWMPENVSWFQRLYHLKFDKKDIGKCEHCKVNNRRFMDYSSEYSNFCSKECDHKDHLIRRKAYKKKHYEENKKWIIEKQKAYTELHKDAYNEYQKEYYEKNKIEIIEKSKQYARENKEKIKKSSKAYYEKNKELFKEKNKKLRNNKEYKLKFKKYFSEYRKTQKYKEGKQKHKIKNPEQYLWRSILGASLKRLKQHKNAKTIELLGYTHQQLKEHLENLFQPGMSWDNHGNKLGQWNVDHKIAVTKFDLDTPPSIVNALSNLQPMWAIDNFKKGNK